MIPSDIARCPGCWTRWSGCGAEMKCCWNALWKASGDHEPHVAANLESVGGNPADFMSADTYGEHDDRQ